MDIVFLGHSSFKIKGKNATLVTDPFSPEMVGFKFPKTEAEVVTISHQHEDHNFYQTVGGGPFVISEPGEYEVRGISVFGYPSFHDTKEGEERGVNNIYVIELEGIRICHLGDLGTVLPAKTVEELDGIDILMIPVGGKYTIGPKEAVEVVGQVEPLIVLPMHFKLPKTKIEGLSGIDEFLSQANIPNVEKIEKLSITKDKLPQETKIVILEPKE